MRFRSRFVAVRESGRILLDGAEAAGSGGLGGAYITPEIDILARATANVVGAVSTRRICQANFSLRPSYAAC